MKKAKLITFILVLSLSPLAFSYAAEKEKLVIFSASAFASPMRDLKNAFQKLNPQIEVIFEFSGSRAACYKITQLKRKADILILADYLVIEDLLMPNFADWYITFARDRMVICFTEKSKYGSEVNPENWYKILTRKDVRLGRVDQNFGPLGYRTLMTWQLAGLYYKDRINGKSIYEALNDNCPSQYIRHEELGLLSLLQSFTLDYTFDYISIAKQHNLKYITLPQEIDLSDINFKSDYAQAKVTITGKEKDEPSVAYGLPITYGFTIASDAPNPALAIKFLKFLLSENGKKIIKDNYQEVLSLAIASDTSKIPTSLKEFCRK
ncbi:MAG: tungstate ABC transporter substrate-binding protein WtpA [Candidatus Omnitrophica bacterium]|nr:tungstate ABC transporter substrate-binding protein WtpA [Candidatus Omnitrophota bacterium]